MSSDLSPEAPQAALIGQMKQMALILQTMAEGVSIFDKDNNLVLANQGFMEMYGFPAELNQPGTPINDFSLHRLESVRGLRGEELRTALEERNKVITEDVGHPDIVQPQLFQLRNGVIQPTKRET